MSIDVQHKHLENIINIKNYRVSTTNSDDSISQKPYTFKVLDKKKKFQIETLNIQIYDPNSPYKKPFYFAADSQQSMTQWINALRLSASIANDLLVE